MWNREGFDVERGRVGTINQKPLNVTNITSQTLHKPHNLLVIYTQLRDVGCLGTL